MIRPKDEDLYNNYAETDPIDNDQIWDLYQLLRKSVSHLPTEEQISILERATALANTQEKYAFWRVSNVEETNKKSLPMAGSYV